MGQEDNHIVRSVVGLICAAVCFGAAFAQQGSSDGWVAPGVAEFRIPLERPPGNEWTWNRAGTSDDSNEYTWEVAVDSDAGRYAFGFYLYKFPGSHPTHGDFTALLRAGQASVFHEDAARSGTLIAGAKVSVSDDDGMVVVRIEDAGLVRRIFASHPDTAIVRTRGSSNTFETVKIAYR